MDIDENRQITEFVENQLNPPTIPGNPEVSLASMGYMSLMPTTCINYWNEDRKTKVRVVISAWTSFLK